MRLSELARISKSEPPKSGNGYLASGAIVGGLGAKSIYDAGKLPQWSNENIARARGEFQRATNEAKNADAKYQKLRQTPLKNISQRKPGKKGLTSHIDRVNPLGRAKKEKADALVNARTMHTRLERAKQIGTQIPARQAQMRVVGAGLTAAGVGLGLIGAKKKAGVE